MSFLGRLTCFAKLAPKPKDPGKYGTDDEERTWSDNLDECNLVSSKMAPPSVLASPTHMPALDIDFPAHLIPSSTPGHFHLYLDKPMSWNDYVILLDVMAGVGILESGFVDAAKRRGATYLRLPNIPKEVPVPEAKPLAMRVPRPPQEQR